MAIRGTSSGSIGMKSHAYTLLVDEGGWLDYDCHFCYSNAVRLFATFSFSLPLLCYCFSRTTLAVPLLLVRK